MDWSILLDNHGKEKNKDSEFDKKKKMVTSILVVWIFVNVYI